VCGITVSVLRSRLADQIKSGELIPVIHDSAKKLAELPGVPGVYDFARTDDDRKVLDLLFGWRVLGRPVAVPPGIPAERLAALRKAFDQATRDKRYVAEADKAKLDIDPAPGEEVAALVDRLFSSSPNIVSKAADAVRN
jgi:tripartite-type tricarboxylate transporter receptor subunit TctC